MGMVINALQCLCPFKGSEGFTDLSSWLVSKVMRCQCFAFFSQLITHAAGRLWPAQVHLPASCHGFQASACSVFQAAALERVQRCHKYQPGARPHLRQLLSNVVSAWQMQNITEQKSIWGGFQLSPGVCTLGEGIP